MFEPSTHRCVTPASIIRAMRKRYPFQREKMTRLLRPTKWSEMTLILIKKKVATQMPSKWGNTCHVRVMCHLPSECGLTGAVYPRRTEVLALGKILHVSFVYDNEL